MLGIQMAREKIEFAPNALVPTNRSLWSAAAEKLQEAMLGAQQMHEARDRVSFERGWTRAIDSIEEFWTKFFDEGKEKFSKFQPWAGSIDSQRKTDELLSYLYQARHQSQHGKIALEWEEEGALLIAPGFSGHIQNLAIFPDGTFEMASTPAPGSTTKSTLRFVGGDARLPPIINKRFKQTFNPPQEHLNKTCSGIKPLPAVELAIEFYVSVLNSAFEKFTESK